MSRAAGVGGDIPAYRAGSPSTQIEGKIEVLLFDSLLQRLQSTPGLNCHGASNCIDFFDRRHALERDNHVLCARSIRVTHTR
jgi:hypothetical protein